MAFHIVQDEKNSLTVVTEPDNIRLSFFGALGMGRVGFPTLTEDPRAGGGPVVVRFRLRTWLAEYPDH
jgi:hypothetical protein